MPSGSDRFKPSQRGAHPCIAEKLAAKARLREDAGEDIIYLQVGQPSSGAPAGVMEAVDEGATHSPLGYSGAAGHPELKERLSRQYGELYGAEVDPERIIITFGASGAMLLAIIGCFDVGQRVALPQPFYYGYRHAIATLGVECVLFETSMENNLQPTIADIEAIEGGIDGLILASPGNPTGSMVTPARLREMAEYCEKRGIRFISDEIYHGIVFDDETPQETGCNCSDETIVVNSFSKYYSMAGWRLGWMVVPEYLATPIASLAHNLYLCPPAPAQVGALKAIDCRAELDTHVERYRRNRDVMLNGLPQLGFDRFTAPHGAFYLYCHVEHLTEDSVQFCEEMLEGAGVLAAPGSDFCPNTGQHYIRFSYAGATEQVEEAVHRISRWRGGS
ncbi:MAG: aminotransferase class I/II-fold pyridoxal phosphate-dependent enzyme [Myxococcota bacterium]|nr:aminotransferase class I/II-fold pyridoxal phosphate-dependent enzyme [Myxococcota bacterium]